MAFFLRKAFCTGVLLCAAVSAAHGAIISGGITGGSAFGKGSFVQLDPAAGPITVGQDNFNTPNLYAFNELQNVLLTSDLAANLGVTTIAAGTRINSHFVFFDPKARETLQGDVAFDTSVLAAITLRPALIGSNYLGAAGVTYLSPGSYGLEPGSDFITLSGNAIRINFFTTDSPGDHFRVITAVPTVGVVPEPAQWAQMLFGFALLGGALRSQRTWRSRSA